MNQARKATDLRQPVACRWVCVKYGGALVGHYVKSKWVCR